jgi:hypothetical protein
MVYVPPRSWLFVMDAILVDFRNIHELHPSERGLILRAKFDRLALANGMKFEKTSGSVFLSSLFKPIHAFSVTPHCYEKFHPSPFLSFLTGGGVRTMELYILHYHNPASCLMKNELRHSDLEITRRLQTSARELNYISCMHKLCNGLMMHSLNITLPGKATHPILVQI